MRSSTSASSGAGERSTSRIRARVEERDEGRIPVPRLVHAPRAELQVAQREPGPDARDHHAARLGEGDGALGVLAHGDVVAPPSLQPRQAGHRHGLLGGLTELLGQGGRLRVVGHRGRPAVGRGLVPGQVEQQVRQPTHRGVGPRLLDRPEEAAGRTLLPEEQGADHQPGRVELVGRPRVLAAEQGEALTERDRPVLAVEHLRHPDREAADRRPHCRPRRGRAGTRPAAGTPAPRRRRRGRRRRRRPRRRGAAPGSGRSRRPPGRPPRGSPRPRRAHRCVS